MARFHEKVEAPKPCSKIIGKRKPILLAESGDCGVEASIRVSGADESASHILWCRQSMLNLQTSKDQENQYNHNNNHNNNNNNNPQISHQLEKLLRNQESPNKNG
ncbi:basic-leucine zipper transcription factor family protein [Striga asiatica]|uniref:Basic-leucine zipper transcription factor family protein n=1 Tax=Striga asiatica TaxID=4170 RepID=A0A5A7QMG6_STRAF|nr:basic-leucine zipper transcription factor family protein [Striga asiatica]